MNPWCRLLHRGHLELGPPHSDGLEWVCEEPDRWPHRLRWVVTGTLEDPGMVRYRLVSTRWGGLYVHHFLKSDADRDLHDHPWHFTSLILWGGYFEEIPVPVPARRAGRWPESWYTAHVWRGPLSLVRHRAADAHRVELERGRTAWTLIWVSRRVREWGFHTVRGWVPWREYPGGR